MMWSQCSVPMTQMVVMTCVCACRGLQYFRSVGGAGARGSNSDVKTNTDTNGECFNTLIGFQSTDQRPFSYALAPQNIAFDIVIPELQGCRKRGVSMSVCERSGSSAHAQLLGTRAAHVTRTGDLTAPGRADFIIYCA